jgi:hypothetical protein
MAGRQLGMVALYVMIRGVAEREPQPTLVRRWFGRTPERAATVLFLASAATELSQRNWPHGISPGQYDPFDIAAFGVGIALCYVGDKKLANAFAGTPSSIVRP